MVTSLNWIKDLVPGLACGDQEFSDRMTMSGTKVEEYHRLDKNLEKIVVGRIEKIERHPDADKLVVCQVNVGDTTLQIVTGAPNVVENALVPVVLDGGRVAGGHDGGPLPENGIAIKAGKLRGVESFGMMCAVEELGQEAHYYPLAPENGIYLFPEELDGVKVEPGMDALTLLGLHDTIYEYEITNNRVDCYSVLGVAREAAATFGLKFVPPVVRFDESAERTEDHIKVRIEDEDLCRRYTARICTDVKLAPSPEWMQQRLRSSGVRPINNLVDITNYVMLEYGQPMHAYDLQRVEGSEIIVRRAKDGERFVTLDGAEHTLDGEILMICDAVKPVGIAGIMGGENSMITDQVKTVLFEAATFNGTNIRKSAKRLGMRTDASSYFEKGLDPNLSREAIDRACQLMQELGCGTPMQGCVDVHSPLPEKRRIPFEPEVMNAYLGTEYTREHMLEILESVELSYDAATGEIVVPSFRQDVKAMCDLAEEIARFDGYDKIPVRLPASAGTIGGLGKELSIQELVRAAAQSAGYSESMSFSFESPKVFDKLSLPEDAPERNAIRIQNPLGEDYSIMRTIPVNGLLGALSVNMRRRNKAVSLYELATIYLPRELPLTDYADEVKTLVLGSYGSGDFFTLKGAVEEVLETLGITGVTYDPAAGKPFLHPGRQALIRLGEETVGYLGELHPQTTANYDMEGRVYLAVLDLKKLTDHADLDIHFKGIAKFPSASRDISMLVPRTVSAGAIEAVIRQRGGKLLESYSLFDLYEGAQIADGFKSMAYNLVFRNREKTIEEAEVSGAMKKVLNGLKDLGIELRS